MIWKILTFDYYSDKLVCIIVLISSASKINIYVSLISMQAAHQWSCTESNSSLCASVYINAILNFAQYILWVLHFFYF